MGDRPTIEQRQLVKLRSLVPELLDKNPYYGPKLRQAGIRAALMSTKEFRDKMPFTTKDDIVRDCAENPPYGSNFTYPIEKYCRFCQSSGTTSGPIPTLDTPESWNAMLDAWKVVLEQGGVGKHETIFFAFSFGPFLGFWTAFEAATRRGNIAIPGGGLSSEARLQLMARYGATTLCCTPTYAIRLGEVLQKQPDDIRSAMKLEKIIVAGEPGGSIPETRARIESLWPGARVWDHHGMTEVGPVTYEHPDKPASLCVIEDAFFAEVVDLETGEEVSEGQEGELILTTLARTARPLLRYRTGDLVKKAYHDGILCLEGGILGRVDDMVVIRGVNIYPAAIEKIVRGFAEVVEFQVVESNRDSMAELEVVVEPAPEASTKDLARRIEVAMTNMFALRIPVRLAEPGSLPRYEFKSKRWIKS